MDYRERSSSDLKPPHPIPKPRSISRDESSFAGASAALPPSPQRPRLGSGAAMPPSPQHLRHSSSEHSSHSSSPKRQVRAGESASPAHSRSRTSSDAQLGAGSSRESLEYSGNHAPKPSSRSPSGSPQVSWCVYVHVNVCIIIHGYCTHVHVHTCMCMCLHVHVHLHVPLRVQCTCTLCTVHVP